MLCFLTQRLSVLEIEPVLIGKDPAMSTYTLPSKAWSCGTLEQGASACQVIAGMQIGPGGMPKALKAWGVFHRGACSTCTVSPCTNNQNSKQG